MRSAAALGLVLVLAGCGSTSPREELVARVDDVTVAANARDAAGLREAAQSLADTASAQRDAGRLSSARASELIALAAALRSGADAVDPEVQARREAEERARAVEAAAAKARAEAKAEAQAEAQAEAKAAAEAEAAAEASRREAEQARQQQAGADDEGDDDDDEKGKGKGKGKDD